MASAVFKICGPSLDANNNTPWSVRWSPMIAIAHGPPRFPTAGTGRTAVGKPHIAMRAANCKLRCTRAVLEASRGAEGLFTRGGAPARMGSNRQAPRRASRMEATSSRRNDSAASYSTSLTCSHRIPVNTNNKHAFKGFFHPTNIGLMIIVAICVAIQLVEEWQCSFELRIAHLLAAWTSE